MNNIRKLRTAKDWTMRDLADRMNVHFTTIAKIERSERKLTFEWVERFAKALDVDWQAIMDGDPFDQKRPKAAVVPVIGLVAAGNWREAIVEADESIAAPIQGANTFGLRVDGESMNLVAPAGSTVLVDPDMFDLHDGSYYVIMNEEGDATFKQYRTAPARLDPVSSDDAHQSIILGRSQFTVVGRVVGVYQDLP